MMAEDEIESGLHARVRTAVDTHISTLVMAVKVLRIPAALAGLPAVPALIGVTILAASAQSWWRLLLLAALAGWVLLVLWWIRVKRYSDSVRDPEELSRQLVRAFELFDSDGEVLVRMLAVFEGGGLRLLYRLRSFWKVVTIPDYLTTAVEDLDAARWYIPPMPATTALRFTLLIWTTVGAWVVMIALIVLRIAGVV